MNAFEWVAVGLAELEGNPKAQMAWLDREIAAIDRIEEQLGIGCPNLKATLLRNKARLIQARDERATLDGCSQQV